MSEDKIFGGQSPFIYPDKKWGQPEEKPVQLKEVPTKAFIGQYSIPSILFEKLGKILEYNTMDYIQIIQDKETIKLQGMSEDRILFTHIVANIEYDEFRDESVTDRSIWLSKIEYPFLVEIEPKELGKVIRQIKGKKDNWAIGFSILYYPNTDEGSDFLFEVSNRHKGEKIQIDQPYRKYYETKRQQGIVDFTIDVAVNKLIPFTHNIFEKLSIWFDKEKPIRIDNGVWTTYIAPLSEYGDKDADL